MSQMPFTVRNFYLFGDSQKMQQTDYVLDFVESLETQMNFEFVNEETVSEYIDLEILENKFGGSMADMEEYWPPRCAQDATKTFDEEVLMAHSIVPFTYEESEYEEYAKNQRFKTVTEKRSSRQRLSFSNDMNSSMSPLKSFAEEESTNYSQMNQKVLWGLTPKSSTNNPFLNRCKFENNFHHN